MAYVPKNPNGQATMANSAPVVLPSDQSIPIGDGTNIAHVLKADGTSIGQNSHMTARAFLSVAFSTTTVQAVGTTDAGNYAQVSVQVATQGTSSTISFQGSNDNTNWVSISLLSTGQIGATLPVVNNTAASTIHSGPLGYRYFRLNITGITAGTTSGTILFFTAASPTLSGSTASTISTLTPGTAAANLGKAEDAAAASADTGVFTLGVRRGSAALATSPTSAVGDYQEFAQDDYGALRTAFLAKTTNPTAAVDGNSVVPLADKLGKQVVVGSVRDLKVQQTTTLTSSITETTVLTAVAATFLDVYGLIIANTSVTACEVVFRDATAGTVRFSIQVPAGDTRGFMLPESAAHNQAVINNNWTATCSTSVASIKITMLAVRNT